jgi:hypothetical protein
VQLFSATELERLVCGNPFLDFEGLQKSARYEGGYSPGERPPGAAAVFAQWPVLVLLELPPLSCCAQHLGRRAMPSVLLTVVPCLPALLAPAEHRVVQWLWQVVNELTPEERKLFLKFFTGSDRAPIGGLSNLRCLIQVRGAAGRGRGASCSICSMPLCSLITTACNPLRAS